MKRTKKHIQNTTPAEINRLHQEVGEALQMGLSKAIEIGQRLQEVKDLLPHGGFLAWIDENLTFTDQTARNYMKLYKNRERLSGADTIANAYRMLKPKSKTVLDLTPRLESDNLPESVKHFWDIRAHYTVLLDAAGWDVSDIAKKLHQPAENISAILDPRPPRFWVNDDDEKDKLPPNWDDAVQVLISEILCDVYETAARIAPSEGFPELADDLQAVANHHRKKADRLQWWQGLLPWEFYNEETGEENELMELWSIAVWIILEHTVQQGFRMGYEKLTGMDDEPVWWLTVGCLMNKLQKELPALYD